MKGTDCEMPPKARLTSFLAVWPRCPRGVKSTVSTIDCSLRVSPNNQTFSACIGMSQTCQQCISGEDALSIGMSIEEPQTGSNVLFLST